MIKRNTLTISLYFLAGIGFILCDQLNLPILKVILKASIIPALALFFLTSLSKRPILSDWLIVSALFFCWAGDVLLEFTGVDEMYFMSGLAAFLIAHIFYTLTFFRTPGEFTFFRFKKFQLLIIILYGALTLYTVMPALGTMLLPVTLYSIVITGMVISALSRYGKVDDTGYLLVFTGAFLFLISDSLIAFNRFGHPFKHAGIAIMVTYILAQFLIVEGMIREHNARN